MELKEMLDEMVKLKVGLIFKFQKIMAPQWWGTFLEKGLLS